MNHTENMKRLQELIMVTGTSLRPKKFLRLKICGWLMLLR